MKHNGQRNVAIIGGGPAGLRAAEVAATQGAQVTIYDHKPSVGRKFLVAGKSGLNLTHASELESFINQYSGHEMPMPLWKGFITDFDNQAIRAWAASLGVETFAASNGKVFPQTKKAAPLLRRWVQRLRDLGVLFKMNHRWVDLKIQEDIELHFQEREHTVTHSHDAVVLALGGASWPQTGSDGTWLSTLGKHGVALTPLQSANCGWECHWSDETRAIAEGKPLHNLKVRAGDRQVTGELMVTRYGLEGTLIYELGRTLRNMESPAIEVDFKPTFTAEHMVNKMESARRHFFKEARLRWKLSEAACAIIKQLHGEFDSADALAQVTKGCRIPLSKPRPLDEVISTSGGVAWASLTEALMIKQLPKVYCAGEMIDWEAPTGGYLMQGCFATGSIAGKAAAQD